MSEAPSHVLSVNDVVARLDQLHGETVQVAGVLILEFEEISISHLPASQRLPWYQSSLWATFEEPDVCSNLDYKRFRGRQVVVVGTIDRDDHGQMGLWPGGIRIHSVQR